MDDPEDTKYIPAPHNVSFVAHSEAAKYDENLPSLHGVHEVEESVTDLYVPGRHDVHKLLLVVDDPVDTKYLPAPHDVSFVVHPEAAADEYEPELHGVHKVVVSVPDLYVPAAHDEQ